MSLIRGVLLMGKFRNHHDLLKMSDEDQRNTLIVELAAHSNQSISHYQALDNDTLAGCGAVLVFLREGQIRDDRTLKTLNSGEQRNILIVELDAQTRLGAPRLQSMSNIDLVYLGLSGVWPLQSTFIRGVLLAGKFRNHHDLLKMSEEDQRNTLIVELAAHSNQSISHYQALDNDTLAGCGAVLVFLREGQIRDDRTLKTLNSGEQANILIVELDAQTRLGVPRLQSLSNMTLISLGLGMALPPPRVLQFRLRAFNEIESNDSGLQGASDEVYIAAQGTDSSAVHFGTDGKLALDLIDGPVIGDVTEDRVRVPWSQNPHVLIEFDLNRPGYWPRTYIVTLFIVEHDNADLAEVFNKLKNEVGAQARTAVIGAATTAGAAIGTFILPGIGSAVGAAAGALAGLGWDKIIPLISEGLGDDAFNPRFLSLALPETSRIFNFPQTDQVQSLRIEEKGAVYEIKYDWHVATRT